MSKLENGKVVRVHYTGTLENGDVFDSSVSRNEPIEFTIGGGQVIPGFESVVSEMTVGEKRNITLQPSEAYGEVIPENTQEIPKELAPEGVEVGAMLTAETPQGPVNVTVSEIKENSIVVDGNHPLAGKTLNFEVELVEVL